MAFAASDAATDFLTLMHELRTGYGEGWFTPGTSRTARGTARAGSHRVRHGQPGLWRCLVHTGYVTGSPGYGDAWFTLGTSRAARGMARAGSHRVRHGQPGVWRGFFSQWVRPASCVTDSLGGLAPASHLVRHTPRSIGAVSHCGFRPCFSKTSVRFMRGPTP